MSEMQTMDPELMAAQMEALFAKRDLWWESREYTQELGHQQSKLMSAVNWVVRQLTPAKPKFMDGTSLMAVDLNKYRPDIDVEMLIDMGVRLFLLRVIGPTQWIYGNEKYEVDPTFTMYHERIRKHAKLRGVVVFIVGYGVYNAWSNEPSNYTGPDPQVRLLKEATRNHLCDQYAWDDEVDHIWKDGKDTYITGTNLVKGVKACMEQTFLEMERNPDGSFKIPIHYSANWFMKQRAPEEYKGWLDSANRDVVNRHMMTWRAWLPLTISDVFAHIKDIFVRCITPTGIQDNAFLRMASELVADLWQFCFTAKGPWCGPKSQAGIDVSTGYGQSATLANYAANANLSLEPPAPADTEPPSTPVVSGYVQNKAVVLNWMAATDNVGVGGYFVMRDGQQIAGVGPAALTYTDNQTVVDTTYVYEIVAVDAAENVSAPGTVTITVTDSTPPPPGDLAAVMAALAKLQQSVDALAKTVDEIRAHFS